MINASALQMIRATDTSEAGEAISAPSESREAVRLALANDALRVSGWLRLRVTGESMLPTLWPGDTVEVKKCSLGEVRRDEIVLATRNGRLFLHRFVDKSPSGFVLRGDSLPAADPVYPPEALIARLTSRTWGSETVPPAISRALGFVLCHCGLARRAVLRSHNLRSEQTNRAEYCSTSQGTL